VLEELHVAGLGVVEDATLQLSEGLNVLTGETGAGKTLIAVGLSLAIGSRAGTGTVRAQRRAAAVEARFRLPKPGTDPELDALLSEEEGDAREVVLARSIGSDARSSARLNGRLTPVSVLALVGDRLVEIHGQNQASRLLSASAQTAFLDRFAGKGQLELLEGHRRAHAALRSATAHLAELDTAVREREREMDLLRYQIREIEAANLAGGEIADLAEEEARLAHAERILELAGAAERAVGEEGGAADRLREAAAAVEGVSSLDLGASPMALRLRSGAAEAADALDELRSYLESVEVDPGRLAAVQERLRALKGLERKYGDGEEGILRYLTEAQDRLHALDGRDVEREELAAAVAELSVRSRDLAARLGRGRARSAPRLAAALTHEIRSLGMPGSDIAITLSPLDQAVADGAERAEFGFSGGPGQPMLPLAASASGGEMSRVMLACRAVLADLDDVPTLVFDEVDAGIGGRTGLAVAERLKRVAAIRQVLVVTHLAQIAARADRHFLVAKSGGVATVRPLDGQERVQELARMLSGSEGTASLEHARELIEAVTG
jgi:DNA repair protein RecN (Recombination protein N)